MKGMSRLSLVAMLLLGSGMLHAEPKLPKIFSDNMVLQREFAVPVWGWADPGEEVTVAFAGQSRKAVADTNGAWKVTLDKMSASTEGREFKVSSAKSGKAIVRKNVLVGDVWFCSGQSNMNLPLSACNATDDVRSANFPNIRCIKVPGIASGDPEKDIAAWTMPWRVCTPQTAGAFTAAGFYFAREVQKETGIPIGLIDDNWGGTAIEPWIPLESIRAIPELADVYKTTYEEKIGEYRQMLEESRRGVKVKPYQPKVACSIFNGIVAPVMPYGIKGALWYQGESNGSDNDIYFHKMRALVGGWRSLWRQGDFPFYFVQLANFTADNQKPEGGDGWAKVRSAQTKSLSIPNTGMAVIIDTGDGSDLHPKNKQDVGQRLALWALAKDYGKKNLVFSGPIFKAMKVEGRKLHLSFEYVGSGLMVGKKVGLAPAVEDKGAKLKRFAIAGADKKWVWADAVIEKGSVVVSSPAVPAPVAVRYAFSANPLGANLYNKEGLPASPLRTDNW